MLVLARKQSEEIVIGELIVVKVIKVTGTRAFIGIDAPDDITIRRGELPETINLQGMLKRDAVKAIEPQEALAG